jgi:parallel beta-helix repeat protein
MIKNRRWLLVGSALAVLTGILVTSYVSAHIQTKTYLVNSNANTADNNPGDGVCATAGGQCTLVAAIQEANADGDTSIIHFAQKFQAVNSFDGCSLPILTADDTTIDASNQWDTPNGQPGVEISGALCDLLHIQANNTTVLGILFGGSDNTGVKLNGNLNHIGGYNPGQRNVFVSGLTGVLVNGHSNAISNNYIGTIDGETTVMTTTYSVGIYVNAGTYTAIADNLIAGQTSSGILVMTSDNIIRNNIIGMSWNQISPLPNQTGIALEAGANNTIGPGNLVAGNTNHGIYLAHASETVIAGNYTASYQGVGNGADGIHIHLSNHIQVSEGNLIAYNGNEGIHVSSSNNITIDGNEVRDNVSHGIHLEASDSSTVTGNYIGLDSGAFDGGNSGHGILIDNGSTGITVGGTNNGDPNWIGWNHMDGIRLEGSTTHQNVVLGNVIGAPINWGWQAPNGHHGIGIYAGANDNIIGWEGLSNGANSILASNWTGVAIVNSNNNAVLANRIGTHGTATDWGNAYYGVNIVNSAETSVIGNEIAYNGSYQGMNEAQAGVLIDGATSINNKISANSIHDNDGPGIKLINGANHNLAAPVITSASCNQVTGTACANCWIEIYSDVADEGRHYEGHFTTPPSGNITFNGLLAGPNVTALAIGPGTSKDTSPFSAPFNIGVCLINNIFLPVTVK